MKYDEIAAMLGCEVGTVKVRVFRAMRALEQIYFTSGGRKSVMTCDEAKLLMSEYWSQALGEAQELAFEAHWRAAKRAARKRSGWERCGTVLGWSSMEEPSANMRARFYETLGAYRHGLESAPRRSLRERMLSLWPKQPAWQMGVSFALLVIGLGVGYAIASRRSGSKPAGPELAQLRGEVSSMRQMVALSLMQQQSAGERLRGVSWAYRVHLNGYGGFVGAC